MKKILSLAALMLSVAMPLQAETMVCADPASDPDGDGWGWENEMSCRVETGGDCIDPDGDGWGWDGVASCRIQTAECIDTDGDGWGWDGTGTCVIPGGPTNPLLPYSCVDTPPLHDTWGWDGLTSCRVAPEFPHTDTSAIAGLWDDSDEFETYYLHILDDGSYESYYSDEFTGDCFVLDDPNANPDVAGAQIFALGGNQYEIYFYEIFERELFEEREIYQMFVVDGDSLSVTFDTTYYDDDIGQEVTETESFLYPAVDMHVQDIELCEG